MSGGLMQLVAYGAQNVYIGYEDINAEFNDYLSDCFIKPYKPRTEWPIEHKIIQRTELEDGEEYYICPVTYDEIYPGDRYVKCATCNKCFSSSVRDNWVVKQLNCPHCRNSWIQFKLFINKKETVLNKKKEHKSNKKLIQKDNKIKINHKKRKKMKKRYLRSRHYYVINGC